MVQSVLLFIGGSELTDSRLREIARMLAQSEDTIYFLSAPTKKLFQRYLTYLQNVNVYNRKDYLSPTDIKDNMTDMISVWIFTENRDDYYDMNKVTVMPKVRLLDSHEPYQGGLS